MFSHRADLFPSNYSDTIAKNGIKEVASEWLQNAEKITSNWKPIGIVGVVNDIEKNSKEWGNKLVTLSQVHHTCEGETKDFSYEPSFDNVKTYFTKLENPTPLSIGLAFLTYLLMLLSWFITKRSTRFPGLKLLFGSSNSTIDEL
ncbi:MAG: hypothetical protein GX102_00040 [Porphyromonadaceae bacterium]|nr:hypothetical protein [Porphyromonadaceae bacterium]